MFVSQIFEEFGVTIYPWEQRRRFRKIFVSKPIGEMANDVMRCPSVYQDAVAIVKDILDGGWSVVAEKPTYPRCCRDVLLARPSDTVPDADDVPDTFVEVTPDQAEHWWAEGYDVIVQLRHYWKCPSGTDGCDVGYLHRVGGEIRTSRTWDYYAPVIKALFGNAGGEIRRYFVEYDRREQNDRIRSADCEWSLCPSG